MKVIVAGSRTIHEYEVVKDAIERSGFMITELVSGASPGVDRIGKEYAQENKIPVQRFEANWKVYGRGAGYKLNDAMASYADALVAIHNGSSGTKYMIKKMGEARKAVHEVDVNRSASD
jgi:YspA, cpYpsA-related SLOG family